MPAAIRHHDRRDASIKPASQADANAWSTEFPAAHPAVILAAIRTRSATEIRDR
jgi:hypothetical protein